MNFAESDRLSLPTYPIRNIAGRKVGSSCLISKRTKEALAAKKANGIKLGRPKGIGKSKLDQYRPEIEALMNNGATQSFIAKRYKTTEANLHHWLRQRRIERVRGEV